MDLTELAGAKFGPVDHVVSERKVADFVEVTTDDAERWTEHAPPGYAAAVLFDLAPLFLWSPDVLPYTRSLLHSEQRFEWQRPMAIGRSLTVSATVTSVRQRSGMYFVGFQAQAYDGADVVLDSASTFLMGEEPAAASTEDRPEPAATQRGTCQRPLEGKTAEGQTATLSKSASRADLVRYAAVSGDFNPLHWDHATATGAGLPGVVCHGLLMAAWIAQAAGLLADEGTDPLAELRVRFRNPLFPAEVATVSAVRGDADRVDINLRADGDALVTGRAMTRSA